MILDPLDLVVPLLKRHLSPSRSGITIEGIDSGGALPQPGCEHAEELADICISPRGTCGPLFRLTISSSPPHLGTTSLSSMSASQPPPGTLRLPWGDPCGVLPLPSSHIHLESTQCFPQLVIIEVPDIPG